MGRSIFTGSSMHKFKSRSAKNVIGLRLSGTLSRAEYQEIVPYLEEKIKEYGKIRLFIELDHWKGWGAYAVFNDIFFIVKHSFQIERVAFLLKSEGDKRSVLLARPFTPWSRDNTRYFGPEEGEAAWKWVGQGVLGAEDGEFDLKEALAVGEVKKKKVRYGPRQNVLIIGGGVAGMGLAALLEQRGFKPHVVEASSESVESDRILQVWPTAAGVLKSLRLYKKALKFSTKVSRYEVYNDKGEFLRSYDNSALEEEYGPVLLVPRGKLIKLFSKVISPGVLRVGVAATKLKEAEDAVKVTFSDGTKGVYDCVICADGLHSKMRELVLGLEPAKFAGMFGWHFSVKPDFEFEEWDRSYRGENACIKLCKIGDRVYGFACIKAEDLKVEGKGLDLLRASFKDFPEVVKRLVALVKESESVWSGGFYQQQTDVWAHGRIGFIGEAASSFLPAMMLSDSMVLESVVVLAEQLSCSDSKIVAKALKAYERHRSYRVMRVQEYFRCKEWEPFFQGKGLTEVIDFSKEFVPDEAYQSFWRWFLEEMF